MKINQLNDFSLDSKIMPGVVIKSIMMMMTTMIVVVMMMIVVMTMVREGMKPKVHLFVDLQSKHFPHLVMIKTYIVITTNNNN